MTKPFAALLTLVRAGLWDSPVDDTSLFPLTADEWADVYASAKKQTVTGLAYSGLDSLPDDMLPPDELMLRWVVEVDRIEARNRKMNSALGALIAFYAEHGIHPVLQKGQGVASMYSQPLLRECGDIDLYFQSKKDRDTAETLLRKTFQVEILGKPDGSSSFMWQVFEVEHHTCLFDLQSSSKQEYLSRLTDEKGFTQTKVGDSTVVSTPAPVLNLLLLSSHILKHAMGVGIGIRQLCDMARAYYAYNEIVDKTVLRIVYEKVGLAPWSRLLHAFLVKYLGLDPQYLPAGIGMAKSGEPLLEIVLRGGNFGHYNPSRSRAGKAVWLRKLDTAMSFWRNIGFSLKYARSEMPYTFGQLLKGQFH